VATQLEDGIDDSKIEKVSGSVEVSTTAKEYNKDEIIEVKVKGVNLQSVNALSFALPYSAQDYEFVGVQSLNMKQMENLTYDRLHSNGSKSLYPTFVNIGSKEALTGSSDLFIIKLKAKHKIRPEFKITDGLLVDKNLDAVRF
jgi:hypothetical protein